MWMCGCLRAAGGEGWNALCAFLGQGMLQDGAGVDAIYVIVGAQLKS